MTLPLLVFPDLPTNSSLGWRKHSSLFLIELFGLVCLQIKMKIVSCHTADSKPVKQEVNSTVILRPLVFPDSGIS